MFYNLAVGMKLWTRRIEMEWNENELNDALHSYSFIQLPMHTFPNPELI